MNMRATNAAALASLLLTGCTAFENYDRQTLTDFDVEPGIVEMRVQVPSLSDWGEETRLRWLDDFVTGNAICANGYTVDGPQVFKLKEWAADVDLYQYTAKCNA
jgi:hypothetical protein